MRLARALGLGPGAGSNITGRTDQSQFAGQHQSIRTSPGDDDISHLARPTSASVPDHRNATKPSNAEAPDTVFSRPLLPSRNDTCAIGLGKGRASVALPGIRRSLMQVLAYIAAALIAVWGSPCRTDQTGGGLVSRRSRRIIAVYSSRSGWPSR